MLKLVKKKSIECLLSLRVMRVTLAIVIFLSMVINGFVPRSVENKESIVTIMGVVVNNVIVETFKSCTDTLTVMSNKITKDLYKYLRLGETGAQAPVNGGQSKEETPVNTSSDSGIEVGSREYEEIVGYSEEEGVIILSVGKILERLYRLYGNIKVYCSIEKMLGVLFFIVFVVAIRNRKGNGASIIIKRIEDKTNLC
jgi:ribulose 1,5-bisphosphate synthetase/thiazole synthase